MPAGELQPDGNYPERTLNFLVSRRLEELSKALKETEEENGKKNKKKNNNQ